MLKRLLAILAAAWALAIAAQHPPLHYYNPAEYSGGTQNWCVARGFGGQMMFGNNYGLLAFDSRHWEMTNVPNYTTVRAVYYDEASRKVYVGASDEFGYFVGRDYTSLSQALTKSADRQTREAISGEIWNIFPLADRVVMQSKTHIFFIDKADHTRVVRMPARIETSAPAPDGTVIVATGKGIYTLSPTGQPRQVALTGLPDDAVVRQIVASPASGAEAAEPGTIAAKAEAAPALTAEAARGNRSGDVVFATAQHGLYVWHRAQGTAEPLTLDVTPYLTEHQIFCAAVKDRQMAIGTVSGGLVVKDFATGRTTYANASTGLMVNTVLAVGYDNNGRVWMGLNNGIAYMNTHTPAAGLTSTIGGIGTGYCSLREGQLLYLGTNQGLYTLPVPLHSQASPLPATPHLVGGMTGQVWTLCRAYGQVMACTDNGLYIVSGGGTTASARRIEGMEGTWSVAEVPSAVSPAGGQLLLACDYTGFAVLQREGNGYRLRNRIKGTDIVSGNFVFDNDGALWVAHWQKGIYRLCLDTDFRRVTKTEHFGAENGLPTDAGNSIVVIGGRMYVSAVGGLHTYDSKAHALAPAKAAPLFHSYDPAPRIIETPSGDVFAINKGYLALARRTPKGYEVDESSFRNLDYKLQYGMGNAGFIDDSHTILNTADGFILVDHTYRHTPSSNPLFVSSITSTKRGEVQLYNVMSHPDGSRLRIAHSDNSLRIVFVMPEYANPKDVAYQCWLKGYDKDWSELLGVNTKEYTQLPKGRYTFCVKAINSQTGETFATEMDIEILPAWYETWWAYILYFVLAALALYYGGVAYARRSQRAVRQQMEAWRLRQREERHRLEAENARKESEVVQLRNSQLELELKHRSSKLADSVTNLIRKNDTLLDIDERLQAVAAAAAELAQTTGQTGTATARQHALLSRRIAEIRREIKENIASDDNWDKFEQNFNLVYDAFMSKLSERFPGLKPSDKRLCAYLRMGLSTKEIASLMNTAPRSIETARYRLRKKLDLTNGENLVDFLQNFDS